MPGVIWSEIFQNPFFCAIILPLYYFILYRFYTYNSYYTGQQKRIYRNYGALMHKQTFCLDYFFNEDLFSKYGHNIIIANSIKKIGNALFFFCGLNDELSGYIKLKIDYIKSKRFLQKDLHQPH